MKKIVVTGGAGFIGSNLVRSLLEQREGKVIVIDNLFSGKEENLAEVRNEIGFERMDVRDLNAILPVIDGADTVYHLAAIPSVPRSIEDPVPSHDTNLNGCFNVFHAAVQGKVRRLIYAASSSAYGDTEVLPKVETMIPRPKSPYAAQKVMGEYYARCFYECYGLEAVALRFFNVYGPRQDPTSAYSGVLSLFITALIDGKNPTILGDGEQSRDFTYVKDVAGLCIKAAHAGKHVAGITYNAGNGNRHTLNKVWSLLQKIEGIELPAKYGPPRSGDVLHSQADTTLAIRDLGHDPKYSLEEGLRLTLEWYRQDRAA
ncbi:MAG: SDR family oxidoreductase [Candidatus Solibacter usitatus]|nr:SDR family oxidoreductase [Candidatus Solibacter usitatus]